MITETQVNALAAAMRRPLRPSTGDRDEWNWWVAPKQLAAFLGVPDPVFHFERSLKPDVYFAETRFARYRISFGKRRRTRRLGIPTLVPNEPRGVSAILR